MIERLIVASAVTWLVVLYFVYDDGPAQIFLRIRKLVGFRAMINIDGYLAPLDDLEDVEVESEDVFYQHNGQFLAVLLSCHRCFGFWIGLLIGLLVFGPGLEMFAVPAIAIMVFEIGIGVK